MPRPSLKKERQQQVFSAYVNVAARLGITQVTLQAIAEQAQLSRPLVRHHLGNKAEMYEALSQHVVAAFAEQSKQMLQALSVTETSTKPDTNRTAALLDLLFAPREHSSTENELVFVFAELTLRSATDAVLATRLRDSIATFEAQLATLIGADYPQQESQVQQVAHGVMAIYFNYVSLSPLQPSANTARAAAVLLLKSLQ